MWRNIALLASRAASNVILKNSPVNITSRFLSATTNRLAPWSLQQTTKLDICSYGSTPLLTKNLKLLECVQPMIAQNRSVTKFSLKKGKRKTVKAVIKRFKRLDWGIWIRTRSGCHKKLFKKSPALRRRLQQHVFVNATQSWRLDKMVTNFWRRPKYYVDDPYEPYHQREEYFATRKKPLNY